MAASRKVTRSALAGLGRPARSSSSSSYTQTQSATICAARRPSALFQLHRNIASAQQRRHGSSFAHLETELPARKIPLTFDYLSPTPSHLLNMALADVLPHGPSGAVAGQEARILPTTRASGILPPAQHLVYFPPAIPGSELLPDGTDPLQSPGKPFVRRMWAGGAVHINNAAPLAISGGRAVCIERIKDVAIKGKPGEEKIFVGIERRIGLCRSEDEGEAALRARLERDDEADFGDVAGAVERRNIVFMRERSKAQAVADMEKARTKQLAPPAEGPDYSATFTPSAKLLFRYSALTYNAHAIHLDPAYCQDVEGHRDMLVHGPLSFTALLTLLRTHLAAVEPAHRVKSVEYRNLAPLYCHEPLKLCGRRKADAKWEVWAETPEGGVAVKGTVTTEPAPDAASREGAGENDLKMLGY